MDFTQLAKQAGCLETATEDVTRRLEAHFEGETPTAQVVQAWLSTTLRDAAPHLWPTAQSVWEKLGMDQATFDAMPPSWRLGQGMAHQARTTPPHPRRPQPREAPADVQAAWKDLSPAQRMTAYRQWRDQSQG